jgi:hypothetical protein
MNKLLISIIIYSIVVIGGIVVYLNLYHDKELVLEQGEKNVKRLEKIVKTSDHSEKKHDEAGYQHNEEIVKMFQDVGQTLSFFVVVLKDEKEGYFTSFFLPQQYSEDQWKYSKNPYADHVNQKFMRELNRNGTLVEAKYDTNIMDGYKSKRKDSEVKLTLIYKDEKKVTLTLNLVLMGTEHSKNDDVYYIKNSVIDLINEVKRQT